MYNSIKIDVKNKTFEQGYKHFEEPTEEELKQKRIKEIKTELEELDTTINRATEDLYVLTHTTPYKSTQEVITKKEELRAELKELNR